MQTHRIMIVDDSQINAEILEKLLKNDYEIATAASGEECLEKLPAFSPDLLLLDIMMPGMDGYEVCRRIKSSPIGIFTQVLLVSGRGSTSDRLKGYEVGADDYVSKPFNHDELLAKVRVQFRLRTALTDLWHANAKIQQFNCELEQLVCQRTAEVVATQDVTVFALAKLADSRDTETGEHLERIRDYSQLVAEQLGIESPYADRIGRDFLDNLYRSSPLHDIGKVGIPDAILLKPGRLSKEEFDVMTRHTTIGAGALQQAVAQSACGGFLNMAIDVAGHHHERFDGTGYPDGLAGEDIPLAARIVALADVYDALTSARIYKAAYDPLVAKDMIQKESGRHFDPVIVNAFLDRFDDFLDITRRGPREAGLAAAEAFTDSQLAAPVALTEAP